MNKIIDQETHDQSRSDENFSIEQFRQRIEPCGDVFEQLVSVGGSRDLQASLFYCDGLIDSQLYYMNLLPLLERWDGIAEHPSHQFIKLDVRKPDHIYARLFAGSVIVTFSDGPEIYEYNIANQPARSPEESTMELSLKGPRDGFVEQLSINVALVRNRLRTPNLHVEHFKIGTESQTQIALMHMQDQAPDGLMDEVRRRLRSIDVPMINGAGHLEEVISDRPISLFPLLDYIGRPDYVAQSLMKGRFVIMVDGTPAAIIGPGNLLLLIKSPEDAHLPFYFVTAERLLRALGLCLSLFLPGFWIALSSFNTDQIPFTLLATVTMSRIGLPMSSTMEMFLMLTLFEVFREAGVRLPRPVGQTVSVVGGLIIGDAAIRAGLTSPTMLVVAAVSAVSTFTLVNQSLAGSVSLFRVGVLILASTLGMFGFFVGVFVILLYLCSLESFGMPYMLPISPVRMKDVLPALIQKPWKTASTVRRRKTS